MKRFGPILAIGLTVLLGLGVLIALTASDSSVSTGEIQKVSEMETLFDGIPQSGQTLGKPDAPVTLVEYGDLRCPICRQFSEGAFREIVEEYVRPGKVRLVFKLQTFVGARAAPGDSERAARMALAAGAQNKFWNFTDLFYLNQGDENTPYATDDFLRSLGQKIKGLDVDKAMKDRDSAEVSAALRQADADFKSAGFQGTPSFQIGRTHGRLAPMPVTSLEFAAFKAALDSTLSS